MNNIRWSPALLEEILRKTRNDSSLAIVAKRFVEVLKKSPDLTIDLNLAAEEMAVQKRRIYDVVNILEGVGLVQRTGRNSIKWRVLNPHKSAEERGRLADLHNDLVGMETQERELDRLLELAKADLKSITTDPKAGKYAYVTKAEIEGIASMGDQTFISIQAPAGTKLEIPRPDQQIQMWLKADRSPIDVSFLRLNSASSIVTIDASSIAIEENDNKDYDFIEELILSSLQQAEMAAQNTNNELYNSQHGRNATKVEQMWPNVATEFTNNFVNGDQDILNTELSNQKRGKESFTTLQTCQSFEQLVSELMNLQGGMPGNQDRPITSVQDIISQSAPFNGIPRHLWQSFPAPVQPNNPVPVPMDEAMVPAYDVTEFINDAEEGLGSSEDSVNPLSPLMSDDVYYLALRETQGLDHLF